MFANLAAAADNMAKVAVVPVAVVSGHGGNGNGGEGGGLGVGGFTWGSHGFHTICYMLSDVRERLSFLHTLLTLKVESSNGDRCVATCAQHICARLVLKPPVHTQGGRYASESAASKTTNSAVQAGSG